MNFQDKIAENESRKSYSGRSRRVTLMKSFDKLRILDFIITHFIRK